MKNLEELEKSLLEKVKNYYSTDGYKYHTINHVKDLFKLYYQFRDRFLKEFPELNEEDLFESIAWHDSVYIVGNPENEELSAYLYSLKVKDKKSIIYDAILSTKIGNTKFKNPVEKVLHDLDWSGFSDFNLLQKNEEKIFFEAISNSKFKAEVVKDNQYKFYKSLVDKDIYVTETFKEANEIARKNLQLRIKQIEKEKEDYFSL